MKPVREIDALIDIMARLPGLGPRSARRAVLQMVRKREFLLKPLANVMQRVADSARECVNCGNISTTEICDICASDSRANGQICIVQDVSDLWAMERANVFEGRYHVTGGTLSALENIGPDELRIPKLIERIETEKVEEVILALSATVDGQTTAHYIADSIEDRVKLTSLAQGVPIGGELDYLDDGTITAAMNARRSL
ncbi:MAG: recombination mediator RecR [Roseovarius sp.]|nr:recombination mediator RecR [Roseovarius sp.]